jgi:FkbM family methyltransferase
VFLNGVEVSDINEVLSSLEKWAEVFGWKYDSLCNCWTKGNVRFKHMRESILAIFEYGDWYEDLNVRGRVVVDVGAYIGDSAIYFAWRGARKVIAIEPHPGAYEEMLENIRLNSLETTIFPINAGLASRPGKILLEEVDIETTNVTYHRPKDQKGAIPVVTLGDLIREFNLSGAVLKMNCEGCEYDVILNDYEHVKKFEELLFQYHAYIAKMSAQLLLKKLSDDFLCSMLSGERFYRRYGGNKKYHGLIKCIRK